MYPAAAAARTIPNTPIRPPALPQVKDRLALGVIEAAERSGALQPGQTVIEVGPGRPCFLTVARFAEGAFAQNRHKTGKKRGAHHTAKRPTACRVSIVHEKAP